MPQQDRVGTSWDLFSQLQRTRQWEADAIELRRPVDFQAWRSGEAAPQSSACSAWVSIVQSEVGIATQVSLPAQEAQEAARRV
jgi:hypothetical protein